MLARSLACSRTMASSSLLDAMRRSLRRKHTVTQCLMRLCVQTSERNDDDVGEHIKMASDKDSLATLDSNE